MSFGEALGGGNNGGIFNVCVDFPDGMSNTDISFALLEIDGALQDIQTPPIASVFSEVKNPETATNDEYRRFYVDFAPEATFPDMCQALNIVTAAILSLRNADR